MKLFISTLLGLSLFSFSAMADNPKSSTLRSLNHEIQLNISGISNTNKRTKDEYPLLDGILILNYTKSTIGAVYYRGMLYGAKSNPDGTYVSGDEIMAKATRVNGGVRLAILVQYPKRYIDLHFEAPYKNAILEGFGEAFDIRNRLSENYTDYWADYDRRDLEDENWGVELAGELIPGDKSLWISTDKLAVGPLYFSECDGCEHGDQLFLTDYHTGTRVNVLTVDLGEHYIPDCPGDLAPLMSKLVELKVPFRYEGRYSTLTGDLWEGTYVMADGGELYLGMQNSEKLKTSLDTLNQFIAKDSLENTEFYVSSNQYLSLSHSKGYLRFNLKTGQTTVRERN